MGAIEKKTNIINYHYYYLLSNIAQHTSIDFKLQKRLCNSIQNAYDGNNKCIKICIKLVAQCSESNVSIYLFSL